MNNKREISLEFIAALINQGLRRSVLREICKNLDHAQIFNKVGLGEITPLEGAEMMMLNREANEPIFIRWLKDLYNFFSF